MSTFAAGDGERRIRGGEGLAVEEDVGMSLRRNKDRVVGEWSPQSDVGTDGLTDRRRRVRHVGQRVGDEAPGIVAGDRGRVGFVDGEDAVAHG